MKRRSFLVGSFVGAVSAFGGSIAQAVTKKPANSFVKVSTLKVGKPVLVQTTFKGTPRNVLVTMTRANKYVVLDATCTHEGCIVRTNDVELKCPCHRARFSPADGAVLGGPARVPLAPVKFALKSGYLCFS